MARIRAARRPVDAIHAATAATSANRGGEASSSGTRGFETISIEAEFPAGSHLSDCSIWCHYGTLGLELHKRVASAQPSGAQGISIEKVLAYRKRNGGSADASPVAVKLKVAAPAGSLACLASALQPDGTLDLGHIPLEHGSHEAVAAKVRVLDASKVAFQQYWVSGVPGGVQDPEGCKRLLMAAYGRSADAIVLARRCDHTQRVLATMKASAAPLPESVDVPAQPAPSQQGAYTLKAELQWWRRSDITIQRAPPPSARVLAADRQARQWHAAQDLQRAHHLLRAEAEARARAQPTGQATEPQAERPVDPRPAAAARAADAAAAAQGPTAAAPATSQGARPSQTPVAGDSVTALAQRTVELRELNDRETRAQQAKLRERQGIERRAAAAADRAARAAQAEREAAAAAAAATTAAAADATAAATAETNAADAPNAPAPAEAAAQGATGQAANAVGPTLAQQHQQEEQAAAPANAGPAAECAAIAAAPAAGQQQQQQGTPAAARRTPRPNPQPARGAGGSDTPAAGMPTPASPSATRQEERGRQRQRSPNAASPPDATPRKRSRSEQPGGPTPAEPDRGEATPARCRSSSRTKIVDMTDEEIVAKYADNPRWRRKEGESNEVFAARLRARSSSLQGEQGTAMRSKSAVKRTEGAAARAAARAASGLRPTPTRARKPRQAATPRSSASTPAASPRALSLELRLSQVSQDDTITNADPTQAPAAATLPAPHQ